MKTVVGISSMLLLASALSLAHAAPPSPAAVTAAPAPNWYDVELIVFRDVDPSAGGLETWPADPGTPDWNSALVLLPPDSIGPPQPYQALSPVNQQLNDAWTRLQRSKSYEPLLHVSWVQPAVDRATAQAVRVGVPPSAVPAAGTAAQAVEATPAYGSAKLSTTGPYLHFDLDLVLQGPVAHFSAPAPVSAAINTAVTPAPPSATAVPIAPAFQLYRLKEDRRVDGGKLTYFDHPLFGAILLVTPIRRSALAPTP